LLLPFGVAWLSFWSLGDFTRMDIEKLQSDAEAGSVVAQGILGIAYLYGHDAPKDYAAALRWLTPAAERGASRPTFHLGRMHEEGWGVPVDFKRAGHFYQRAADQDEWLAYVHLARLYRFGRGTIADDQAALDWYRVAVSESETIAPCPELDEAREYVSSHHGPAA
jgi:TPR repeat protein